MVQISASLRVAVMCAVFTLQACTTQMIATPVEDFTKQAAGQVYYLPRAEFQITVSRELKACATGFPSDADAAPRWLYEQLNAMQAAPAVERAKLMAAALNEPVLQQVDARETVKSLLANTKLVTILDAQDNSKGKLSASALAMNEQQIAEAVAALQDATAKLPVKFDVEINAQAVPSLIADTEQAYAIDFKGMQSDLKGTDYAIESYPNGTLKSINVTIDDQTGAVLQGVISGAAKLAAGFGGFPFPSVQGGALQVVPFKEWKEALAQSRPLCNADVRLKLLQRDALAAKVDADADAALETQKNITKLGEAEVDAKAGRDKLAAQLKDLPDGDAARSKLQAALKLADAALKKASSALADAKEAQAGDSEVAAKTAARLAAVRKALTVTSMTTISPLPAAQDYELLGQDQAKHAWLDKRAKASCGPLDNDCYVVPTDVVDTALAASAALYPVMAGGGRAKPSQAERGIWYRQPLKSNLYVCVQGNCLTTGRLSAPPSRVVLTSAVDVPQFGPMAFLLLENKAFQNNTIAASFAETGALTKLSYKTNAAAAKAAEVFESSADTVMKFKAAKQNQGAAKANAQAAELDARKKLVDAQLALEKAQADLDKFRDDQKKEAQ